MNNDHFLKVANYICRRKAGRCQTLYWQLQDEMTSMPLGLQVRALEILHQGLHKVAMVNHLASLALITLLPI